MLMMVNFSFYRKIYVLIFFELVIVDQIRDELVEAAERSKVEPLDFLRLEKFGDLAEDSKVCEVFCRFLKEIREKTIKECVREMNSESCKN